MTRYERLIGEMRSSMKDDEAELEEARTRLGRTICESKGLGAVDKSFSASVEHARVLTKEVADLAQQMASIRQLAVQQANIDAEAAEARRRIEKVERRNEPLYEVIGESAYHMYLQTSRSDDEGGEIGEIGEIFADLDALQEELRDISGRIERESEQQGTKTFLRALVARGRQGVLRARRVLSERTLPRLYRNAGRAVCQAGLKDYVTADSSSSIAKSYWTNLEEQREIRRRLEALEERRRALMGELDGLGASVDPRGRAAQLQEELNVRRTELQDAFRAVGERAVKAPPDALPREPAVEVELKRIEGAARRVAKKRKYVERLEAALERDRVGAEIERLREARKRAESEAERHRLESKRLEARIAEEEKRMDQLSRVAGSVESLVQEDEG